MAVRDMERKYHEEGVILASDYFPVNFLYFKQLFSLVIFYIGGFV